MSAETTCNTEAGHVGSAVIAGHYRYALWRDWRDSFEGLDRADETCLFVMLNPSTAGPHIDDPTLTRCISFARGWGFGKLAVGNLYAWRSPSPKDLATAPDPIGRECDEWLEILIDRADLIVAAWGASEYIDPDRAFAVAELLDEAPAPLTCLERTEDGHPAHPLYLPGDLEPEPFTWWRELYG